MTERGRSGWRDPGVWVPVVIMVLGAIVAAWRVSVALGVEREHVLAMQDHHSAEIVLLHKQDSTLASSLAETSEQTKKLRRQLKPAIEVLKEFARMNHIRVVWPDEEN